MVKAQQATNAYFVTNHSSFGRPCVFSTCDLVMGRLGPLSHQFHFVRFYFLEHWGHALESNSGVLNRNALKSWCNCEFPRERKKRERMENRP